MKALEEKILKEGTVYGGEILKVDGFLNHRIDVAFLNEIGKEIYRLYQNEGITKILTIEASGIGIACVAALHFDPVVPVVFAKKTESHNISKDVYLSHVHSYTKGKHYDVRVSKEHLSPEDKVLIIDDFLAMGSALMALTDICKQAGASIAGASVVIEKAYQGGGDAIRASGIRVEALARIQAMSEENGIEFIE